MNNDNPNRPSRRLYVLAGFLAVILLWYIGVLFYTQIIQGDYYLQQAVRTITRQETVEASRGIITDRNGTALVSNRLAYHLTFDASLLDEDTDANEAILELIRLFRSNGVSWNDELPISSTAPYAYTIDEVSSVYKDRFFKFLQDKKLISSNIKSEDFSTELLSRAGITASALLEDLEEVFEIPADWSAADARAVVGVRYSLAARQLVGASTYLLVEDVDSALLSVINDGGYAGAKVVTATTRSYETDYAAHVLGVVGDIQSTDLEDPAYEDYPLNATIGRSGVERAFESYLRGINGTRLVSFNSDGKVTSEAYSKEPQPGSTVELTLDLDLQAAVEEALAKTVSQMNAADGDDTRGAGAAVVQVGTGEVLALASYPTYNLASYYTDYSQLLENAGNPLYNRATQGTYAPGSTLKPLTAVAALETGVTTLTEEINDTGYWYYPGSDTYGTWCWDHSGHGLVNVTEAITNSCNYFFATMGYRMGMDTLVEYLQSFGLGQSTGIEIGDKSGTLPKNPPGEDQAPWAAYGQSSQAYTPIQLANYIATLVGGGDHYEAHLLRSVKSYDNTEVLYESDPEPVNTVSISDSTLEAVKEGMLGYTQPGGQLYSYFTQCVVKVGAKTGTAQLGGGQTNNGVFVCFAPYDDPQIAMAIVIEHGNAGANLASAAVEILNAYFGEENVGGAVVGDDTLLQ